MEKNYFIRNGKVIKRFNHQSSLQEEFHPYNKEYVNNIFFPQAQEKVGVVKSTYYFAANVGNYINKINEGFENSVKEMFSKKFRRKYAKAWISASVTVFPLIATVYMMLPPKLRVPSINRYFAYTAKPLRMDETSSDVYIRDSRSQRINEIFKYYKCPLEGMGEVFVHEADKNNIPWWLVASIAFQESTCGKFTPKVQGQETYNAWGWAVYGDNVQGFDNWARGVETVSKYMSTRFFSKGITDTCDIMKVYTPPSNGSWCKGVDYFGDIIQNYKSPAFDTTDKIEIAKSN
jgi:hypothetical protein